MPDRRPITAAVRRRAWGEVGVRPWTFLTLLLAAAAVVVAVVQLRHWRHETFVIEHGTPVTATVVNVGMDPNARQGSRDEALTVALRYTPPGSDQPLESFGTLPRKPGGTVRKEDTMRVNIDPDHPAFWKEETVAGPWGVAMITPLICGGVAALCGLAALARRAGVLRAYKSAEPRRATVASVRQSPLAPFSKLLRVTPDDGPDRRTRDVYWPNAAGPIHPQQAIEILFAKRHAFAAAAYGQAPAVLPGDVLSGGVGE